MKKNNYRLFSIWAPFVLLTAIFISGCVNYEQTTKLNADGSGTMTVHYWTKMSNFSMGTTLGKFDFEESKAKSNFTSGNSEVKSIKVEDRPNEDSTKHVTMEISFKDINKLSDAVGFQGARISWKESTDGMELKYTLLQDTSAANTMGASDYKVVYVFDMPSEIISTNSSKKEGQTLTWNYTVADLGKDIDMTANVKKAKSKTCGIFGMAIAFGLIGLAYYTQRNKKKKK